MSQKTCPYCRSAIQNEDLFIICPDCNTVHHRDCWNENFGCTRFGCKSSNQTKQPDRSLRFNQNEVNPSADHQRIPSTPLAQPTPSAATKEVESRKIFCPQCGTANSLQNKYCLNCGNGLSEHTSILKQKDPVISPQQPVINEESPLSFTSALKKPEVIETPTKTPSSMDNPLSFTKNPK